MPLFTDSSYSSLERMGLVRTQTTTYPRESSIVDAFQQQVINHPDRLAVKDSSCQMTYSQLDLKSDLLARWLVKRQFAAGALIGVLADRSCYTVIAFLGILKANVAYLPLDPKTPASRLGAIFSSIRGQSQNLILLGARMESIVADLKDFELRSILDIVSRSSKADNECKDLDLEPLPSPTSLAYVMFTSGTTGRPKGVMVEHRNVVRLVKGSNMIQYIPPATSIAHISSIAFDASTWEIYASLLNGGTLVCLDPMVILDYAALPEIFNREQIRSLFITPALLRQYIIQCPAILYQLDALYVGGDRLDPSDIKSAQRLVRGSIINGYGPTENTSFSTMYCFSETEMCVNGVPIGRAISNSGAYVMDPQQRLVPLGVVGELVVTGDGLARGYIDPQQDSGRFITVIIGDEQVRAYRTGDCVRQRPVDGQLEFLGRLDGQVKIQGYRVEPGEVDHIIRSQEDVKDAITVLQEGEGQEARLISFITINNHGTTTVGSPDRGCEKEHVEVWKMRLDNETYSPINRIQLEAVGRDFIGWTSMYDGSEIDKDEMNEWLDDTIEAILDGKSPGHVLEVGTGSGMILFNLTEGLQSYTGLDLSERAVNFVVETARSIPTLTDKVTMYKAAAASVSQLQPHTEPNLVVLNSVVQYFPSQEYLVNVIRDLLQLRGVETLFFGDIRSYALYKEFLASRALYIAGERASGSEIQRIMHNMEQAESELLVDPAFFTALLDIFPDYIEHVEILPKKMQATNELSCYRYAAVIYTKKGQEGPQRRQIYSIPPDGWIDYMDRGLDRQSLTQLLQRSSASPAIAISNIPHDKTIFERHVVDTLASQGRNDSDQNNWLSAARQQAINVPSLSANDLVMLAKQANYQVEISWARQHTQRGGFDAVFHRQARDGGARTLFRFPTDHQGRPGWSFTSRPLQQKVWQAVQEQLHETLRAQLPSYMVPQRIVILDSLPLNANGKVDRQTLARDAKAQDVRRGPLRQPTLRSEREMQKIWAKVLNIDPETIGIDDNFFHLGGSSIAAMKVVGEASRAGMKLTVADIFRQPTLHHIAVLSLHQTNNTCQNIEPFSLISDRTRSSSFLNYITTNYHLNATSVQDAYPCTPLQEGLLSLTSMRPGGYIAQEVFSLSHCADVVALCKAFESVSHAMPILRTRFVQHDAVGLVQVVLDEDIHWNHAVGLDTYLEADLRELMVLGQPYIRYALVKDESGEFTWLVWTIHHALYDGWSMRIIKDAVSRCYYGHAIDQGPPFSTFIRYIGDQKPDNQSRYWLDALSNCECTQFPSLPSWIEYPVVDEVIDTTLASVPQRTGNITTSNLVRAAWAVVVSRITNSTDVVFGATISGRNAPVAGIDAMAAPTFATVPLRLKVSDSQKVLEYLAAVQEQAIEMIPYEQTGLHRIAKLSADTKKACMFQTLLVVQPQDIENTRQVLHEVQRTGQQQRFNNYALVLELHLGSDSLTARASFDPRILEAWMVHKLLTSLEVVMHQLDSAGVETTLSSIDMVTTKDLDQIWSWNGSNTIPVNKCVHDMIVDLAQAQPTAPAICSWDGELTYHELDQLSSSLASELIRLGIRPDTFVPLCFEKSMWAAVAMMSVLKAGGAFVHLDMSQASDRRERILAQLNANVVLASRNHAQTLAAFGRVVIPIDAAGLKDLLPISRAAQILRVEPLSAAYAIFTSGSTGQPKGVVVEHRSMSTSCFWLGREMGVNEHSRVLQFSSYSFDGCIMDIFTTLLYGGCVCIPNDDERLGNLEQGINRLRANHIFLTPSVARLLNPNLVPSLETIVIGGEIATDEDFKRWQHLPRVIHAYGPTECTIICCLHSKINIDEKGAACIGKAVGSVCWVVSPENHNRLAPLGSIGELVVEGPVLARGYLNDPEGTALVFIENPPWLLQGGPDHPGRQGRLYKTGDLVRYNKDGTLDFIGRKDTQVKISGQRVELGEVEHHVGLCIPAARQVVAEMVTLQGEGHEEGKSMLAAFLVMDETALERNPSDPSFPRLVDVPRAVEDALGESLPAHMKPAIYLAISKVPISSSGKTNRRELRDIGAAFSAKELSKWRNRAHADKRRPPSTEMERMLQQVWARVLKISPADIGVDESFLSLGGDSITAMRVSMVARSSGIDISAVDILRKKTISRLAASVSIRDIRPSSRAAGILEKSRRSSQPGPTDHHQLSSFPSALGEDFTRHGTSLLAQLGIATTDEIENIYPCTPFQRNIHAAQSKDPSLYRVILELEIAAGTDTGGVDLRRIERAWRSVVRRHSLLRTHLVDVTMGTGRMMNVVLRDPAPRITFETDSAGNGQQEFGQTRIGYSKDGLQHSLSIHQTATDRAHLRLEISHAIIDGYSTDILLRDFRIAYGGTLAENGPPFGEFVEYVEQQLQEADCDFWTKYLSDVPVCFFPTCMSHRTRAGTFRVTVPSINTHKLQAFCVEHEFTTASVIQVAWALVLHRYTGSMTPCFGILAASRDAPVSGVGDMFGPLLHLIPYRVALDSRRSVLETLKEVQGDCIDSLSHQVHPLTACQKSRCIGISRLFNTALSFIKTEKEPINQETTHIIRYIGYQDPVEYDVYIRALDRPGDLDIVLEFWNESISLIKGTEVAACLSMVLSAIISQDEQTIHRLISHMEVDCTGS